nr:hypothetical protein [Tanacetum cinerariifolium]
MGSSSRVQTLSRMLINMGTTPSRLPFAVVEPTGLNLPAERGLSVEDNACPTKAEDVVDVEREGVKLLRVGVDGPKGGLIVGEFIFPVFVVRHQELKLVYFRRVL